MPYSWDPISKRFRDPKGRYIAERDIRKLLDVALDVRDVTILTTNYKQGLITKEAWHSGMRALIKRSYAQAGMLAKGGRAAMRPQDWGRVGGDVGEQYWHLDRKPGSFLEVIDDLTLEQAIMRAKMYVNSSRQVFEEIIRDNKIAIGAVFEKWVLGIAEHCEECIALSRLGIVPIGTLGIVPGEGKTICLTNCKCRVVYYNEKRRRLSAKDAFVALGGAGSGHFGHAGRPGRRGGSAPKRGGIAKGDDTELYRWADLAEIVDISIGRARYSMDMTDKVDFYFAPVSVRDPDRSWVTKVYGRAVFDRAVLGETGWGKDPILKVEGAWRWKPGNLGGTWKDYEKDFPLKGYLKAFRGFEVTQLPKGHTIEDVKVILDYRLERDVPVVQGSLSQMTTLIEYIPLSAKEVVQFLVTKNEPFHIFLDTPMGDVVIPGELPGDSHLHEKLSDHVHEQEALRLGGPGSGFHGHAGRPGKKGW